ncbi:MAG: FAD-dependent oxidoreductase, partial [Sphingomonadales bacterium]|nr:FAD-dependent oxidoreductase [Sphingomonadales bacterium]
MHRIVVVGGGAGGLELATRLGNKLGRRKKAHITLIDRRRTHLWKPLLHEIAAGSMDLGMHQIDYLAQAYWHGFTFRLGALIGIDRGRRLVRVAPFIDDEGRQVTPAQEFGYDTLVISIGTLTNDFNTRGVKSHAIALETAEEAERFH